MKRFNIKNAIEKIKKVDYRAFIWIGIIALLLLPVIFTMETRLLRLYISLQSIGKNFIYYWVALWDREAQRPMQTYDIFLSLSGGNANDILPADLRLLGFKIKAWADLMLNKDYFKNSWEIFVRSSMNWLRLSNLLMLIAPIIVIFIANYNNENAELTVKDVSKPLKRYLNIKKKVITPCVLWLKSLYAYIKTSKIRSVSILFVIAWDVGLLTVALDIVSLYLYFITVFDFMALYKFVLMAVIDLYPFFGNLPLSFYIIASYLIFDASRMKKGIKKLNKMEKENREFIQSLGVSTFITGVPGSGKTLTMTDMAITTESIFRDQCFDIINECRLLFPHFPWREFEIEIESRINTDLMPIRFINRLSVRKYVEDLKRYFDAFPCPARLFGYNIIEYPTVREEEHGKEDIFTAMIDYGQAYFMYLYNNPIAVANYSIRFDAKRNNKSHFPDWDYKFFERDNKNMDDFSRYAKQLDWDMMRLGKKVIPQNPKAFTLDGCVIVITEIGKDRGNLLTNRGIEADAEEANQYNDLLNAFVKLARHPATVRHRLFMKMFFDDQRPTSLNADLREICETLISLNGNKTETKTVLTGWILEPIICGWLLKLHKNIVYSFRKNRDDKTFIIYAMDSLGGIVSHYLNKRLNRFSYRDYDLIVSNGSIGGQNLTESRSDKAIYHVMSKKILSKRYQSDCFSDFFDVNFEKSTIGFKDLPEYTSVKATMEQMIQGHGYFPVQLAKWANDPFGVLAKMAVDLKKEKSEQIKKNKKDKPKKGNKKEEKEDE